MEEGGWELDDNKVSKFIAVSASSLSLSHTHTHMERAVFCKIKMIIEIQGKVTLCRLSGRFFCLFVLFCLEYSNYSFPTCTKHLSCRDLHEGEGIGGERTFSYHHSVAPVTACSMEYVFSSRKNIAHITPYRF